MAAKYDIIVVTGPTASGKTAVAAMVADQAGGEVISADSRQVYRGMDIGTGKDYTDYMVGGRLIPYHLIDIVDAGYKYNVFEYQRDFLQVYNRLTEKGIIPVVCGGSGMYLDSIVSGYRLFPVPADDKLRQDLSSLSLSELKKILSGYKRLHNETDVDNVKRAVRAIEIEVYYAGRSPEELTFPVIRPLITAISYERNERRIRITERLRERFRTGMIEEVEALLASGLQEETLLYYGLEYKYGTRYLRGEVSYEEMFRGLETAIHQFSKRQMTWFRGMERRGIEINWIDGRLPAAEKVATILELYNR
ncbi:MAG: tRNA (adenosine(37)-N6)-dimethylallyltransferase MiaA [Bacteroidales bacterium]|nr:tRNA (adenosine(37)-N6)-dimethylallyltransferase MiaA [Bacteroidales bacterium]